MAKYRKIDVRVWTDEKFSQLNPEQKLFALYALSGSQTNRVGLFSVSLGMASELLGISGNRIERVCHTVCHTLSWLFDIPLSVLYLPQWWKYNSPANSNAMKGALKDLDDLPKTYLLHEFNDNKEFQAILSRYGMVYRIPNGIPNGMATQYQEQELEQEYNIMSSCPKTGQPVDNSGAGHLDVAAPVLKINEIKKNAMGVLHFLNAKANRQFRINETNLKFILERLKSGATETQCRQVVIKKCREWGEDEKMSHYLRPETLFNKTKFESYLGELVLPKEKE